MVTPNNKLRTGGLRNFGSWHVASVSTEPRLSRCTPEVPVSLRNVSVEHSDNVGPAA
jgi:hypothetical protein